eukprot:gene36633-50791_t
MAGFVFPAEALWGAGAPEWAHEGKGGEDKWLRQLAPNASDWLCVSRGPRGPFRLTSRWQCLPDPACSEGYPLVVHNHWEGTLRSECAAARR